MTEDNNDKTKRGDVLSPRKSFGTAPRRRREPELQKPIKSGDASPAAVQTIRDPGPVLMTWRVDRLRERPLVSVFVLATLVGLLVWLVTFTQSWLTALVLTGIVIVSLSQFIFPTTFTLSENGLTVTNLRKDYKPWSRFAVMRVHPDAVQIGPRVEGVRARWNRGTLIYFGRADKNRVAEIVKEKLGLTETDE